MAKRNEDLTREHEARRCAHEKLKAEQEQRIEAAAKEAANHEHAGGVSRMLSSEGGSGLIVKVVVCKKCSNGSTPAKCEVGIWDA
jgi:hypothetical protein